LIIIDANLLVYAKVSSLPQHPAARAWLEDTLTDSSRVGLPWPSLVAFLRLVTNPRIFPNPLSIAAAWKTVQEWLEVDSAWIPLPTEAHPQILERVLIGARATANHVPDAHLAALAIEHGLTLCSTDGDFARFPGLSWKNPLT
jgi:toxin-antitoxin system PIN domain toxin